MTPGSLSFAAREWFWPAVVLFAAALFFVIRSYAGTTLHGASRVFSIILKTLGVVALLAILLEPTWTSTRPREGVNLFALVADNSSGLQLRDAGESRTRGEKLRDLLGSERNSWQARLEETFVLRRYLFDSRLESARDFSELNFHGRETALGSALTSVHERFQGQPLAGVLLFTDGIATDLEEGFKPAAGAVPVYPVVIGKTDPLLDVALKNASVSQSVFEDAPVTVTASVNASGFKGEKMRARITLNGNTVSEQTFSVDNGDTPLRFQLKPDQPGISFYQLSVGLNNESSRTNLPTEATLVNNSRYLAVDRGRGPHRLLYVGGRPNWEFKFMNRAVGDDPQLQLVSLIRIARREPKFTFRGRVGESSNPLFRGFNQQDPEETERYDQPVLIRVNTKDENELRGGFPKAPEDLYAYEGIVLDDVEAEFFTPDQMMLVQRYVSERGGGLMMLGGADSLQDGKYLRTPIGEMLPFYLDRAPDAAIPPKGAPPETFHLELTREGWLQSWIRLRATEEEERERLTALPGFQVLNRLRETKPGAVVLATVKDPGGKTFPAVATQRFGNGRVAAVAVGDWWRGSLQDEKSQADLGKSWRQMLRWVIADVPKPFELRVQAEAGTDTGVKLEVRARDKNFAPLENAAIQIAVQRSADGTNRVLLTAEPADKEPGVYRASFIPREPGPYVATATITDSAGVRLGEAEAGWASEPLAREFASLTPNIRLLEEIARKTGGQVIRPEDLPDFAQGLKKKKAPIVETYSFPLWHTGWMFAFALVCFVTEWGFRRVKGLA